MLESRHKISMVVAGRNDSYGGDFAERFHRAFTLNLHNFPQAELVLAEWNPVAGRPLLSELATAWWGDRVSCYVVDSYFNYLAGGRSFAEYPAKNVGIRRAKGDFILVTNCDIVIDPTMNLEDLRANICYRARRVSLRLGCSVTFPIPVEDIVALQPLRPNAWSGDFTCMDRRSWQLSGGYNETVRDLYTLKDDMLVMKMLTKFLYPCEWLGDIVHIEHERIVHEKKWEHYHQNVDNPPDWGLLKHTGATKNGIAFIQPPLLL